MPTPSPILLLPGLDGTTALLEPLIQALGPDFEPIPVPLPGGASSRVEDLLEDIRTAAPPRPHWIFAQSASGPLAILHAARHPEHLRGLVLCASFAAPPLPPALLRLAGSWLDPSPAPPPRWAIRAAMLGLRPSSTRARQVRAALAGIAPGVLRSRLDQVATLDVREELADLRLPVLALRATRDRLVRRSAHLRLVAARPDLRVVTIPGPHLLAQARPQAVARAIEEGVRSF